MFKKILLTSLLLFTFFGSISLGDCPTNVKSSSSNGCTTYSTDNSWYCNNEQWITLYQNHHSTKYTLAQQQQALWYSTNFCSKLGMYYTTEWCTCQEFQTYNEKQNKCVCQDWYVDHEWACVKEAKDTKTPQETPKCWEHAYTCENGVNPSDQKYNEKEKTCTRNCGETKCPEEGKTVKCSTYSEAEQQLWIGLNKDCLVHGGCSLDVYKTLWIRQNSEKETRTSVLSFFQDVIGASTFFIGTILTIAFVISGFRYVLAGASGNDPQNAKNGMKYSIIGFVLVMSAYAIIRFVQYLASTGG